MSTLEARLQDYRGREVRRVKLALTDIDGVLRGKYISLEKFASIMRKGGGFCDCILGWDSNDQLYDNAAFTGWHTGFPDAQFRLLADSERWLAEENTPFFLGEFVAEDNQSDHDLCPRTRLRSLLSRASSEGIECRMGFEYEFFVFDETSHSVREKYYQGLHTLTPGNFGYSIVRSSTNAELFNALLDYCLALECPVEGLHCETGPGVWEAALEAAPALEAADRANIFKTFAKVFFQRQDLIATFMAKWSMDYPGQSGHCHFSLWNKDGENLMWNPHQSLNAGDHALFDKTMTDMMRHCIGGLQRYLPEMMAMVAPTINSYTRLVRGAWAPTASTWGIENRTTAIRAIPGSANSQRLECRAGGADGNPYLVAAAILAAGLQGIRESVEPGPFVEGNAYDVEDTLPEERRFPTHLRQAAERLDKSSVARESFGEAFVDHYVATRLWEAREYERHVNDWQLKRYFEII